MIKNALARGKRILFPGNSRLFMKSFLAAPGTEFLELNLPLHLLLILVRIIIPPFANGTAQGN